MMNGQEASALVAPVAAAAREMLRLEGNGEDALILRLAMTALGLAEAFCGQRLVRGADAEGLAAGAVGVDAHYSLIVRYPVA